MVQDGWMCDVDVKFGGVWALEELVPKKTNFRPVRKLLVCLFSTSFSNVIYPRIFARLWYTQASCNQKKFQFFLKISATFLFYCLPGANEPGPFPIIELINTSIGNATLQQTYKLYTTRVYSKLILLESYSEALHFCVVSLWCAFFHAFFSYFMFFELCMEERNKKLLIRCIRKRLIF